VSIRQVVWSMNVGLQPLRRLCHDATRFSLGKPVEVLPTDEVNLESHAYHLEELAIAKRRDHRQHIMPPIEDSHLRILDVGCGAGQTLIGSNCGPERMACGTDVDASALRLGKQLTDDIHFACAAGEALPYRDGYFDLVISRVALPYMHVPSALGEFARVSRPGATLWLVLHAPSMALKEFLANVVHLKPKAALGRLQVLANTIAFHFWGKLFRPLGLPYESCQTRRGMSRALAGAGYEQIEFRQDRFFVARARKSVR
jgi:SAM-dependent methyltransferase